MKKSLIVSLIVAVVSIVLILSMTLSITDYAESRTVIVKGKERIGGTHYLFVHILNGENKITEEKQIIIKDSNVWNIIMKNQKYHIEYIIDGENSTLKSIDIPEPWKQL